jgi:hypothetical protein
MDCSLSALILHINSLIVIVVLEVAVEYTSGTLY